jgi:hypothetical protein
LILIRVADLADFVGVAFFVVSACWARAAELRPIVSAATAIAITLELDVRFLIILPPSI